MITLEFICREWKEGMNKLGKLVTISHFISKSRGLKVKRILWNATISEKNLLKSYHLLSM